MRLLGPRRTAQLVSLLLVPATLTVAPALAPAALLGAPEGSMAGSTAGSMVGSVLPRAASAAAPVSVATARTVQDGSTATVRGYVVGQPTATSTVVTSGFPDDYALALADAPGETATSRMVYVQVPSAFRASWGLRSNPALMGRRIDVTGTLGAYFSAPGVRNATAFALADGGGGTTPPPSGGTDDYDSTYYAGAVGKTGSALETSLHTIVSRGVARLTYDEVWAALRETDQDPADASRVIELYTGESRPETDNGGGVEQWNREHVWAKSHGDFGTATGPGTDLHHLRPADVTVNSARGNLDFDEGGSQNAEAPGNYADGDSWEPRDADKGDVARMIFFMSVRYEGGDGFPDLEVNDRVANGTAPLHGKLSTLLRWNAEDPPSAFEMRRNDVIYERFQFNRNPFIDHPEWADAIW
ncbi:endonuclease [Nocardioides kribbensis]|uniref:endonuclease n=1 Tax=Nocardioides kribbensis TaxID=305517 RepID=UPI00187A72B6|nr:endonuclease [Nocardioides kribbensis]